MKKYIFEAIIKQGNKGGAYVEFPYSTEEEFGIKGRIKISCTIEGIPYQGSLVKMKTPCHILLILKSIRIKLNKEIGASIKVILVQDLTERIVELHPLLKKELDIKPALKTVYKKLSYTIQKEMNRSLAEAKKEATRKRRLDKILVQLKNK